MRKCYACHEDSAHDWYYWTKNKYAHFIVFRERDNKVATGIIYDHRSFVKRPGIALVEWRVNGPCWSTYEDAGTVMTLDEAKKAVDERVMKIIEEEFEHE
jgi:hypothetical protein